MPKVELNLEDDELKELLLGDRDKAMQSIMAKILVARWMRMTCWSEKLLLGDRDKAMQSIMAKILVARWVRMTCWSEKQN